MTMGKKHVSIKSVPVQKHRVTKLKKKRRNDVLGKVLGYLKSDTYLFAPLISQSRHHRLIPLATSTGFERADPVIEKKQKLVEKLVDYLRSDYHMYAPLVLQQSSSVVADECLNDYRGEKDKANGVDELMKNVTSYESRVPKHQTNGFSISSLDNGYSFGKTSGVKHTLLQKETVKHVIQHKHHLSSHGREGKGKAG